MRRIDNSLKQVRDAELKLKLRIRDADAKAAKARLAAAVNPSLPALDSVEDAVRILESGLKTLEHTDHSHDGGKIALPALPLHIEQKLKDVTISGDIGGSWASVIQGLGSTDGLKDLTAGEITKFLFDVPLKVRGEYIEILESMTREAVGTLSPLLLDGLMAGYADIGRPEDVERLLAESPQPTVYSYGHLTKAYRKTKNFPATVDVLTRMARAGLEPSVPIYTTVIQACIQEKSYEKAFQIFDNMKYLSTSSMPTAKTYNSMIFAAAKMSNSLKSLDLYQEMLSLPTGPIRPNQETYNLLVYACARDPLLTLRAWEFFMEMWENKMALGKESMQALLYLCGQTGELLICRALVKRLCAQKETFPDEFIVNALFHAYCNYDPNNPSKVMSTPVGEKIRTEVLFQDTPIESDLEEPPFLPVQALDHGGILLESEAMTKYFYELKPEIFTFNKTASATTASPVLHSLIMIGLTHGNLAEFKKRFSYYSKAHPETDDARRIANEGPKHEKALIRQSSLYALAIKACIKFKDLQFARDIWSERGAWRKTSAYKNMTAASKQKSDFTFAQCMVDVLATCGEFQDAIDLVRSSLKLFRWKPHHLQLLLSECSKIEDTQSILKIRNTLKFYHET